MCDTCTGGVDSFVLMPHTYTHLDDTIRWSRTGGFTAEKRFVIVSSGGPRAAQVAMAFRGSWRRLACLLAGYPCRLYGRSQQRGRLGLVHGVALVVKAGMTYSRLLTAAQ